MKALSKIREISEIVKKIRFQVSFLIFCTLATVCMSLACDKSRKVFDGITYGEISHGLNSNYTQVVIQLDLH